MSPPASILALDDESVPLCFDTSAVFGSREAPRFLRQVRDRFPGRMLIIPAWVVAERVRQLRIKYGNEFDPSMIRREFLNAKTLDLFVAPFDEDVALLGWVEVTGRFTDEEWSWENHPLKRSSKNLPCAERCRSGDHAIYATASAHRALLVTNDDGLLEQVKRDGYLPGAVSKECLRARLDLGQ